VPTFGEKGGSKSKSKSSFASTSFNYKSTYTINVQISILKINTSALKNRIISYTQYKPIKRFIISNNNPISCVLNSLHTKTCKITH